MREHRTYVQPVPKRGTFFAVCRSCGSDGFPDRHTLAAAEADAQAHGTLDHIYPPDQLGHISATDHDEIA